jgi:hypothetical protein
VGQDKIEYWSRKRGEARREEKEKTRSNAQISGGLDPRKSGGWDDSPKKATGGVERR